MEAITLPVVDEADYDVVVCGGGLSGVCASIAAARAGARTLLIESRSFVGGNGTTGLPISSMRARNSPKLIVKGIPLEIINRVHAASDVNIDLTAVDWIPVDSERLQLVLLDMLLEASVDLMVHSPIVSVERIAGRITRVFTYDQEGRVLAFRASTFVDSTGDAKVATLAGLPTLMGRERDGQTQNMTLMFGVAGVEEASALSLTEHLDLWRRHISTHSGLRNQRMDAGPLPDPARSGFRAFNATRIVVGKGAGSRVLTSAEIDGRLQVGEYLDRFLRPSVAGFENAYLVQIATHVGVRETRRVRGIYEVTQQDILEVRKFEDAVACNANAIEIHSPESGSAEFRQIPEGEYYTVPYRALVVAGVSNLLASGRCISATHEALAALRVLSAAMATGQAAGLAAALAALERAPTQSLSSKRLRDGLRKQGAYV